MEVGGGEPVTHVKHREAWCAAILAAPSRRYAFYGTSSSAARDVPVTEHQGLRHKALNVALGPGLLG